MRTRREIFAGLGVLALAPMLGVAQEEKEAMPSYLKHYLETLTFEDFKLVWKYFDSNEFAVTEMTDVLVASHTDAEATP
jgi:hypothetical protein